MRRLVAALLSGAIFGVGLAIAGMTRPEKVIGFLDLAGAWDPSLAFVMVGAIAVHVLGRRLFRARSAPWFEGAFHAPARTAIDRRLVVGAAVFGIGWGLGGFCPGPGIVSAASGTLPALLFLVGMTAAIAIEGRLAPKRTG